MFIIVHVPGNRGSLLFKAYTANEAQFIPGFLSMLVEDKAEVIITNVPGVYGEYEPYERIHDRIEFVNRVLKLISEE